MGVGLGVEALVVSVEDFCILVLFGERLGRVIIVTGFDLLHLFFIVWLSNL